MIIFKTNLTEKLIARVKLNLRKSEALSNGKSEPVQISYGPIEINREKYEIFVDGEKKFFLERNLKFYIFGKQSWKSFWKGNFVKRDLGFRCFCG